ncbi:hypothetical protein KY348_06390 [Candidatus Woesearchaeota archaeon]|nr:hypothetical protein [Candidatus Woesearchaeota archaeon]
MTTKMKITKTHGVFECSFKKMNKPFLSHYTKELCSFEFTKAKPLGHKIKDFVGLNKKQDLNILRGKK